jgi:hypothetical protein
MLHRLEDARDLDEVLGAERIDEAGGEVRVRGIRAQEGGELAEPRRIVEVLAKAAGEHPACELRLIGRDPVAEQRTALHEREELGDLRVGQVAARALRVGDVAPERAHAQLLVRGLERGRLRGERARDVVESRRDEPRDARGHLRLGSVQHAAGDHAALRGGIGERARDAPELIGNERDLGHTAAPAVSCCWAAYSAHICSSRCARACCCCSTSAAAVSSCRPRS